MVVRVALIVSSIPAPAGRVDSDVLAGRSRFTIKVTLALPTEPRAAGTLVCVRPSVIVVDDDGAFRRLASRLLAAMGFDVLAEVGTAAQALAASEALHPDAVLVDVSLPDGDGL